MYPYLSTVGTSFCSMLISFMRSYPHPFTHASVYGQLGSKHLAPQISQHLLGSVEGISCCLKTSALESNVLVYVTCWVHSASIFQCSLDITYLLFSPLPFSFYLVFRYVYFSFISEEREYRGKHIFSIIFNCDLLGSSLHRWFQER